MADTIAITAGTGTTVATDDIGGVHYQRVKIGLGADGAAVDMVGGTGTDSTGVPRVTLATDVALPAGTNAIGKVKITNDAGTVIDPVAQVAHDGVDSGAPIKIGLKAIAHGTNPTAVAAADRTDLYANRAGIPFVIAGHPNIIARHHVVADADGAQTDYALSGAIGAGAKVIVTQISVKADKNNSGNVAVKIGFGTANVPTPALAGVNGLIINEDLGAGEGHQIGHAGGIVAIGADGEELRMTCDDPAGGALYIGYSYYTIES